MTEDERMQHAVEHHGLVEVPCAACDGEGLSPKLLGSARMPCRACDGEGAVFMINLRPCGPGCPLSREETSQ